MTIKGYTVFIYVIGGKGTTGGEDAKTEDNETIILFEDGEQVEIKTEGEPIRFLLVAGKQLNDPISWGGPIVMNTKEELDQAFHDYRSGRFIK